LRFSPFYDAAKQTDEFVKDYENEIPQLAGAGDAFAKQIKALTARYRAILAGSLSAVTVMVHPFFNTAHAPPAVTVAQALGRKQNGFTLVHMSCAIAIMISRESTRNHDNSSPFSSSSCSPLTRTLSSICTACCSPILRQLPPRCVSVHRQLPVRTPQSLLQRTAFFGRGRRWRDAWQYRHCCAVLHLGSVGVRQCGPSPKCVEFPLQALAARAPRLLRGTASHGIRRYLR
jgi:hypothetical protein